MNEQIKNLIEDYKKTDWRRFKCFFIFLKEKTGITYQGYGDMRESIFQEGMRG